MRALALLLCLQLTGATFAQHADAPAADVVLIRVGDPVPFDGILTAEGEYMAQAKGIAAITKERDGYAARPSWVIIIIAGVVVLGGGVALGYGLAKAGK